MRVSEERFPSTEGTGPTNACDVRFLQQRARGAGGTGYRGSGGTEHTLWGQPKGRREAEAGGLGWAACVSALGSPQKPTLGYSRHSCQ